MPRTTLIVTATLAALALSAPVATAMPSRDTAGTTATAQQDLRSADARVASVTPQTGTPASGQDFRSPDAVDAGTKPTERVPGLPTWPLDPEPIAPAPVDAAPVASDDDTSPLLYILPGLALSLMLATGLGYAVRTSGRARRARISA